MSVNNDEKVKKNPGSKSKKEIFTEEREAIIKKFDELLNLTEKNRFVCVNDISDDIAKQICDFAPQIKKFFTTTSWGYFNRQIDGKPYISLLKSVYKDCGYTVELNYAPKNSKTILNIYK